MFQLDDVVLENFEQTLAVMRAEPDEALDEMAQHQCAFLRVGMDAHQRMLGFVDRRGEYLAIFAVGFRVAFAALRCVIVIVGVHGP